jgi:diguanylate cyclase (GGDEF)-like protein
MNQTENSRRIKRLLPLLGAAAVGLAMSTATWFYVSAFDEKLALKAFYQEATDSTQILKNGLDEYSNKLIAIGTLFSATQHDLTRKEFVAFSGTLFKDQPAILGLSWVPRVTRAGRAAHELAARADGIVDYQIHDVGPNDTSIVTPERDEYLPIYYSTKEKENSKLYGFNLRDGGLRQRTFERARDEKRIVASPGFLLRSGQGDRHGFIAALPIYLRGYPSDTLEERRRNIEGYVLGIYQIGQMVDTILANVTSSIDISLFETNAGANDKPVYVRSGRAGQKPAAAKSFAALQSGPHWTSDVSTSGKHWTIVAPAPERLIANSHMRAWQIFSVGLLLTGIIVAFMWISVRNARRLESLARTDPLTGLANRVFFSERLDAAFSNAKSGAAQFAVHFIDLDGFKDVNDSFGHSQGDLLLQAAVLRLRNVLREQDVLARFGGDEFAILQTGTSDPTAAAGLAKRIISAMSGPFEIEGDEITVTASVGITMYSAETATPDAMMIEADLALYRAKNDGRNCYRFHNADMAEQVHSRIAFTDELRTGIERGELELYYQAQVEIASGRILGLEALVRWNNPKRGLIMPSVFIPVAEKTAIIHRLGGRVFDAACAQMRKWQDEGIAPQTMAVNVSGIQIKRLDELVRDVAGSLAKWRIAPDTIELELTETVLMEASQKHFDALGKLRDMGLHIAIDDFGTGYSSLKYLTVFPVNRLKIAQDLVFHVTDELRNATVVKAAIRLAHELDIAVIAEGVETEAQAQFLLAAGCHNAQGYYYSQPVNAEAATNLLRQGRIETIKERRPPALKSVSAA